MSEERLKKIKDSIDFQMAVIFNSENDIFLQEELELYNEVIRLRENSEKVIDLIQNHRDELVEIFDTQVEIKFGKIVNILKENK